MKRYCVLGFLTVFLSISTFAQSEKLQQDFSNPPKSARPYVWWHWMNGNISKDGIRKDLMWMDRVGIAGFHQFDAAWPAVRPVMEKPLIYLSDEWKEAFHYSLCIADSLGMEVAVAACPGFSSTGGPWVKPEDAMKKLVWRTVDIQGDQTVTLSLPEQFKTVGVWQNYPRGKAYEDVPEWYQDIAVIALRLPDEDKTLAELGAKASSSAGDIPDLNTLTDGDYSRHVTILPDADLGYSWLQYEFPEAVTIRALQFSFEAKREIIRGKKANFRSQLQCSDDGKVWKNVCRIPDSIVPCVTMDIPPTSARFFRIRFMKRNDLPQGHEIREFNLFTCTRVHMAEGKAGFEAPHDLSEFVTPYSNKPIRKEDVQDLTALCSNGILSWNVPSGRWRIYRFGASLTGKKNHPTIKDTEGLEVDKLDPEAWTRFFHNYLDLYREASGGMLGEKGIQYILNDSYEAGQATWTPRMFEQFRQRHGYELNTWLPALAGMVIGSSDETERFLWDWRQTLGELFAENHDMLNDILAEYGMKGRYTESHENGHAYVGDGMDLKRSATVPMSAFWYHNHGSGPVQSMSRADIKESASVAHIYGQNIVAAESFTSSGLYEKAYTFCPENLKPLADFAFSCGLNRIVIHDSAHQPVDDAKPGIGLLRYGQWFNRHETWAEMAGPWMDYLARSCYMLQQGQYVADVLVYYGEDNSITGIYGHSWPDVDPGYQFDFASPSVFLNELEARNGKLITATGMEYSLLYLGTNCNVMSLPVLRKLAEFADAGVDICGIPPERPASLEDDDTEFYDLVDYIWNKGKEDIFLTHPHEHLSRMGIAKDLISDANADFVHRRLEDGSDIYWVHSLSPNDRCISFSMRTDNSYARLFNPEDGTVKPIHAERIGGRTSVKLNMAAGDAYFIVLTDLGLNPPYEASARYTELDKFSNSWDVTFEEGRGAPDHARFPKLQSWTENDNPGIKYYSGVADYTTTINLSASDLKRFKTFCLDLGNVKNIAEVSVNGKMLGTVWKYPWRIETAELASALHKGNNTIQIKVANLWVNRIIGDLQPGAEKFTTTPMDFYKAESPLLESGLIGPVKLFGVSFD